LGQHRICRIDLHPNGKTRRRMVGTTRRYRRGGERRHALIVRFTMQSVTDDIAQRIERFCFPRGAWFKARLHVELGEAGLTLPGRMMAP